MSEKANESKTDFEFKNASWELFYLSQLFRKSHISNDYSPNEKFSSILSLTSCGEKYAKLLKDEIENIGDFEINFLLFAKFGHEDIFIDPRSTDINAIRCILNDEIICNKIRYPWIFDRLLYDKFFDIYEDEPPKSLSYEETIRLLENTPMGVFQLGNNLVGPYGLLVSRCKRSFGPTLDLPLWHCPNPVCNNIHYVTIFSGNERLRLISKIFGEKLNPICYPNMNWAKDYEDKYHNKEEFYDDLILQNLPHFLMAAFNLDESQQILKQLIDAYSDEIRALFPKRGNFTDSYSIVKNMNKNQCLQLMLLVEDKVIINGVESLIDAKKIEIPATEIRAPKIYNRDYWNWIHTDIECSRFGIRNSEPSGDLALCRLRRLIKDIYENKNETTQLEWKLRHIKGESLYEKLDRYIFLENPDKIISELVLDNIAHLDKSFELLRHGNFLKPRNADEEKLIIKKILWKLGFNIYSFPDYIELFWKRFDKFIISSRLNSNYGEDDREKIRSSAVNFFVSLEQVLNYSLSFITWALLSDHYLGTKFKLDLMQAQEFMAEKLSGTCIGDTKLDFDPAGKNTLFPLVIGFDILANHCKGMLNERDKFLRCDLEIPSFTKFSKLQLFPFSHKALILDLREKDREKLLELLKETNQLLTRAQICSVRNRIEHARSENEFPTKDEIENACAAIKIAVKNLLDYGVCPSIHYFAGMVSDEYKREICKYKDSMNNEVSLLTSTQFDDCGLPEYEKSMIIVPLLHIGDSVEPMRFGFKERSNYTEMWSNYPKRRT